MQFRRQLGIVSVTLFFSFFCNGPGQARPAQSPLPPGAAGPIAQIEQSGISGVVVDARAADLTPIEDVAVELRRDGQIWTTRTNHLGCYRLENLRPGSYDLAFSHPKFQGVHRAVEIGREPLGLLCHQSLTPVGTALVGQTPVGPGTLFVAFQDRKSGHSLPGRQSVIHEILFNPDLPGSSPSGWMAHSSLGLEPNPIVTGGNHLMTLPPATPGRSRFDAINGTPTWTSFSRDGHSLVVGTMEHRLSLYDTAPGLRLVQNFDLGGPIVDLQIDEANRALITVLGMPSRLYLLDLKTNQLLPTIKVEARLSAAISAGTRIYTCCTDKNCLLVTDGAGKLLGNIPVGQAPTSLALSRDGRRLYCANSASASVSVIDIAREDVGKELRRIAVGVGPQRLALSPDDSRLVVSNRSSNSLSIIDAARQEVVLTSKVADSPLGLAISADGQRAYVACVEAGLIQYVDLRSGWVEHSTTPMPNARPWGLTIRP